MGAPHFMSNSTRWIMIRINGLKNGEVGDTGLWVYSSSLPLGANMLIDKNASECTDFFYQLAVGWGVTLGVVYLCLTFRLPRLPPWRVLQQLSSRDCHLPGPLNVGWGKGLGTCVLLGVCYQQCVGEGSRDLETSRCLRTAPLGSLKFCCRVSVCCERPSLPLPVAKQKKECLCRDSKVVSESHWRRPVFLV